MAFDATAKPLGQQLALATTISTAESYLYSLCLTIVTARNLQSVVDYYNIAYNLSNLLFALNDPNLSTANSQKIQLILNNIYTPFNSQVYPILTL